MVYPEPDYTDDFCMPTGAQHLWAFGDRVAVMSNRPGRIKAVFDVGLARPRHALELRNDPAFIAVRGRIWDALREEVLAAGVS
jgi:ABC-type nitrate/sulfonate/bicarbonate transport system ATPase subunit